MDRDQWHEILAVLGRNKLRSFLTAFGVFWGIFMLVIMLGSAKGLENGAEARFAGSVTNSVYIWAQQTSLAYQGFQPNRTFNLRAPDAEAIRNTIPAVDIISPRCQSGGHRGTNNVTHGVKIGAFTISGDYPQYVQVEPVRFYRWPLHQYPRYSRKAQGLCNRPRGVQPAVSGGRRMIGTYLKAQGVNFKVVGLFKSKSDDARRSEEEEKSIHIPLTTFQQVYNYGNIIGWLSLTSQPEVPATRIETQVKELLKQRHKIHPDDERAFGSWNKQEAFNNMMSLMTGINLLSLIVGSLTLLAGAIGVSNIMLVIVKERTREFGVRRAIGATPGLLFSQVMLESVFLTTLAGIFGIVAGVWLLEGWPA
ncbi:MAG: ABC transporter permease [Owenweeksia sp.]|nr:ABC transporter permease [Owenweeksia sp.]